ncbi:MAG: thrombospondin type 3 repeat-containing protein [Verrucomicrobiota bacterium]
MLEHVKIYSSNPGASSRSKLLGLVLFGLAAAIPAHAAQVVQAAQGDVLLAFRNTAASSSGSYLVNVGPASQFVSASPGSTTPLASIGALGADLDAFDATDAEENLIPWNASSSVVWSAFSRNSADNNAVFISRPRPSLSVKSTSFAARSGYQHNIAVGEISSVISQGYNVLSSTVGVAASANNARGAFQTTPLTGATSYFAQVTTEGRQDFGTWPTVEKDFGSGAAASAIDFYVHRLGPSLPSLGTVTYLGYFSISSAGLVSFTAPSAPDPFAFDTDGDGFSDGDEALAGTDAQNASSFFKLVAPVIVAGTSTTFSQPTIASRKYTIQYNDDLLGPWTDVHVHLSGAGAAPLQFVDTNPVRIGQQKGFYRAFVGNP